jgi:hypothetical protein
MNNRHLATYLDDFHSNSLEMTTRIRRIRQNNLINDYYQKGF